MKPFAPLLLALLATLAFSTFVPIPNYNLSQLQGTWYIQSIYDTKGSFAGVEYCAEVTFDILNETAVNFTFFAYGMGGIAYNESEILTPDPNNSAILYEGDDRTTPLLIVNASSIPYWVDKESSTIIFGWNITFEGPLQYVVLGASRWYDTMYDIRPFLVANDLPLSYSLEHNMNFWFVNTACDTHFGYNPIKTFKSDSLLRNWNLIAVYDPVGSDLVPWYTGSGMFDWEEAYCGQVSFNPALGKGQMLMDLSVQSLYFGSFKREWLIQSDRSMNSLLMGFNIDQDTLLYVQYVDLAGNLILTAGTTTSFFLSTSATTLTTIEKGIFEVALKAMGSDVDFSYIYPIDSSAC